MRIFTLLALALSCVSTSFAQTNVGGTLTQSAEWNLSGSPYTLTGTLGIPSGVSLVIKPGVTVNGNFDLLVKGSIDIQGVEGQLVTFQNTRLLFKSADLAASTLSYIQFNQAGVQLADESEFSQDSPKNSSTLIIKNSIFSNTSYARTKGYQSTAKLRIENSTFSNSQIYGFYPRSEVIELENADISNCVITSDSYNYGILITNSSITAGDFRLGCCGSNFDISDTEITSSSFTEFNNYSSLKLLRVNLTNTFIDLPSSNFVSIKDSKITATSVARPFLVNINGGEIIGSTLKGYAGLSLIKISGNNNATVTLDKVNLTTYDVGLEVSNFGTIGISSCNFLNGSSFNVKNTSNKNINAQGNYWGTTNEQIIKDKILDLYDNINYGVVDYSGFLSSAIITNPLPVPTELYKGLQSGGTLIQWKKVNNPNVLGYKIYKKSGNLNYTLLTDAGNSNSFMVLEAIASEFVITSYDISADGTDDLLEGHESDFSSVATRFFVLNDSNRSADCEGSSIEIGFAKNFVFNAGSHFSLTVSMSETNFADAMVISSIGASEPSKFVWQLPDTISAPRTFFYRVVSDQLNVFTNAISITVNPKPVLGIKYLAMDCPPGNYTLDFDGTLVAGLTLSWDVDGASIIQNNLNKSLLVSWNTSGEKKVILTGERNGCSTVLNKKILVDIPAELEAPTVCSIVFDAATGGNNVSWEYENVRLKGFNLYRESNKTDSFELLAKLEKNTKNYLDKDAESQNRSYRYKLSMVDVCGKETAYSNALQSLHLQLSQSSLSRWNLNWEKRTESAKIEVYRGDGEGVLEKIESLTTMNSSYTDTDVPLGPFYYQLKMNNSVTCVSESNIVYNGITGIADETDDLNIFPNPTTDEINFVNSQGGNYLLIDSHGSFVQSGKVEAGTNKIAIKDISAGLYLLKIVSLNKLTIKHIEKL